MKKWIWIVLFLAALAAGLYYFFYRSVDSGQKGLTYHSEPVRRGDITRTVTASGSLEPVNEVTVGAQITGTISRLFADFNSRVTKGQVIAEIDPAFLQAQLQEAEANLTKAKASLEQTTREFKRAESLYERRLISDQELESARTNDTVAKATVSQAQAARNRAATNLQYATIYSPIDGIVVSRKVEVGQTVAASLSAPELFVIAEDMANMQVVTYIDESDIGQIQSGQSVEFTVDAYPELVFSGTVNEIRLASRVEQSVVTYPVVIGVENPDLKLLPGMTANVTITVASRENALKIPSSATRFSTDPNSGENNKPKNRENSDGRQTVHVLKNGELLKVRIKTGLDDGAWSEVVEGDVSEGDQIVTGTVRAQEKQQQSTSPFGMPRMRPRG